ncbi:hypothetical protein [Longitalea luteola]|uniref:hypothetical protein n=1 Tax=Longitalea luteola TaxID=2812563 RepID=UPI001A96C00F|nr:hypothetical protein [Longitalea luteola]
MKIEIVTKEDLELAKNEIIHRIRNCLFVSQQTVDGYRTKEARLALKCSSGKFRSLLIAGKLRAKKIGGTISYLKSDVVKLLNEDFKDG